jgi:hypothetical protein
VRSEASDELDKSLLRSTRTYHLCVPETPRADFSWIVRKLDLARDGDAWHIPEEGGWSKEEDRWTRGTEASPSIRRSSIKR